jgi:sugar lactone lactonase YvrE
MPRDASVMSTERKLRVLLDGGRYFEGPRWHTGRLWFVDCFDRTLLSLGPTGDRQQHAKVTDDTPCGLGILPDGNVVVLTMFRKQLLKYADGQLSLYADLSQIAAGTIDDMIVDGLGRCYVGDLGFNLPPPAGRGAVGRIILILPNGETRVVADGLTIIAALWSPKWMADAWPTMKYGQMADWISVAGSQACKRRTAFAWTRTRPSGSHPSTRTLSSESTGRGTSSSG